MSLSDKKFAIVGAGNMGSGIAQKTATEALTVVMADLDAAAAERGHERIRTLLQEGVERRIFRPEQAEAIAARVRPTGNLEDLHDCDVIVEAENLSVEPAPQPGQIRLEWDAVSDICLTTTVDPYRIYAATTARPAVGLGDFPDDPGFELIGTTSLTSFTYLPLPEHQYYLVVAVGTDLRDGLVGHYGE